MKGIKNDRTDDVAGLYKPKPFWCSGKVARSNAYAGNSSTPVAVMMTALVVSLIDAAIVDDHWN
eukprot:9687504-Ditylum_brightwellii.AAC.1